MANIIRGTTPTIVYKFKTVNVQNIVTAFFTIKQLGILKIKKSLNDANVDNDSLSWRLSQKETLSLATGNVSIMLNWVTSDGTRGSSKRDKIVIEENHIEEAI